MRFPGENVYNQILRFVAKTLGNRAAAAVIDPASATGKRTQSQCNLKSGHERLCSQPITNGARGCL